MQIINNLFSEINRKRCLEDFRKPTTRPIPFFALAISGEAGELANIIKKVERGDYSYDDVRPEIGKEIADIFTYLDLLCEEMGLDFSEVIQKKFDEVSERIGSSQTLKGL